jgi:hypothetical protein
MAHAILTPAQKTDLEHCLLLLQLLFTIVWTTVDVGAYLPGRLSSATDSKC